MTKPTPAAASSNLASDGDGVSDLRAFLSPIEDVLEDARNGRMFILMDAEDRENEGDLVIPAQMATPDAVNFMAKFGRGLICLSLSAKRCEELQLPLMSHTNESRHRTAFTVSIEAREGITTGISAHDRAHTIAVAIDPTKDKTDIVSPGHVFPLVAKDGGVLVRTGHTEAAVDIARLAGLNPAGVICEIMNDDGTMARAPDLIKFAQHHDLKMATIEDLIAYRLSNDNLVVQRHTMPLPTECGTDFQLAVFEDTVTGAEHFAVTKGAFSPDESVLVRMHAVNVLKDMLGVDGRRQDSIAQCMRLIERHGQGAIVVLRDVNPKTGLTVERAGDGAAAQQSPEKNLDDNSDIAAGELRDYGIGAQILRALGIRNMKLMSNTPNRKIVGLEGWGLKVNGYVKIPTTDQEESGEV